MTRILNYLLLILIINIFIINAYSQANAGEDQIICTHTTILQGDEPPEGSGVGLWTLVSGAGDITDNTLYNTTVTNIGKDNNVFRWDYNGTSDEVTITNNKPTDALTSEDVIICENSYQLVANQAANAETGAWSIIGGYGIFDDSNMNNTELKFRSYKALNIN